MGKVKLHFQYNVPDMKYAPIYARYFQQTKHYHDKDIITYIKM